MLLLKKMCEENAIYGGEMSAHHYFRDFTCCDSGMIPWSLVAELLSISGKPLSKLVGERIAKYPCNGKVNYAVENVAVAITRVENNFIEDAGLKSIDEVDGLSMEFDQWRFNLRTSNTESLLRLNLEARGSKSKISERVNDIASIVRGRIDAS